MLGISSKVLEARRRRPLAWLVLAAAALPLAAQASVVVTFDWVANSENPTTAQTTTPTGVLQLTLSSFATTGTNAPPNYGTYYASGTATSADITAFSYTAGDGLTVGLANLTSSTLPSIWATSGLDTPAGASSAGYYLISSFSLSGTTSLGSPFQIANGVGTAGATYANGIGNADNSFNAVGSHAAITDGGYWEVASIQTVPLPSGLVLLISGLMTLGCLAYQGRGITALRNSAYG